MDAVEFIKERRRMCDMESCSSCPADSLDECDYETKDIMKLVQIVEQWSKEHPQKTMMQDFFEKFPNAPLDECGLPTFCPSYLGYKDLEKCDDKDCSKCWSRPMEVKL